MQPTKTIFYEIINFFPGLDILLMSKKITHEGESELKGNTMAHCHIFHLFFPLLDSAVIPNSHPHDSLPPTSPHTCKICFAPTPVSL